MEEIGKHISELLFDHDCVIVPTLGGFLASNQPSRVLLPNHILYPPYRRIAFNVYLKQNDGLLANHLVESENIPYSEAIQIIDSFTSECFETLENGRKISLTEIGTLYYDKEKNIQFEAFRNFNHLKDSFGMEAVHFLPVQRDEQTEKKKIIPEKTIRPSVPLTEKIIRPSVQPETRKGAINFISRNRRLIGIAAISAAFVWFSLNLYFVAPKHYESTSLSPFDSEEIVLSKIDSIRNTPSTTETTDNTDNADNTDNTDNADNADNAETTDNTDKIDDADKISSIENSGTVAEAENSVPEVKIVPPPVVVEENLPVSLNKHYVVAGVFKILENAQSMVAHLQQLGFPNAQLIVANKLHYVTYDGFSSQSKALALADSLRYKKLDGWIWKH